MAKFLKTYELLYKKAMVDLNTAKVVLESFENGNLDLDLEVIFFHFQQCAEKIIKSYLDFKSIKFPHTHDLKNLLDLLEENNLLFIEEEDIDLVILLTQYAVEGRYSVIHDDLDDTDKYIALLEKLSKGVKNEMRL